MESSNIEFILEQMSTINLILTKTSVWQTLMFFLNTSFLAIGSANVLVDYFVTSNNYTCRVPQYISLLDAIPVREDGQFEKCLMYANFTSLSNETVPCTNGHSHALPVEESIVATFRLYCDREYLKNIPQSAFFGGATVGALLVAIVGDKYGKKPLALSGCWMSIVFGVGCALSNSIYVLVFFRFMSGMSYQIYGLTSYILMIELFPAKYRGVPCVLDNLIWITGMLLLCLSAYFVRKWRYLFLTVCMPSILTISYYWLMDESVFWLATKNRHEDVNIILAKAYRLNSTAKENQILYHVELQESNEKKWYEGLLKNLKAIFASVTFLYALACGCGLISLASTFYLGSTFASSSFSTNIYLDFFISTLVEVPIIFVGSLAMRYLRRKTAIIYSLYLVALVAMPFALIPTKRNNVLRVLNHVYKAVATLYSNFAYSYVSEIYPTKYRQFGMGITVIVSQLHSTISPFIRDWVKSDRLVTMVVFGSLAVLATLAIVFLPETKNRTMIDIKDMMGPCKCAKSTFQKKMDDPSLAID